MNDLIAQLSQIFGIAQAAIWQAALVLLRVGAAVALIPALGEQAVPQRVKLAAALSLTLVVLPTAPPADFTLFAVAGEAITGLALGMGLRHLILGLQTAGVLAAQSVSLSQMFGAVGPEPQPIVANVLTLGALVLFVALGGLSRAVELLVISYQLVPTGQPPDPAMLAEWGLARVIWVFGLAFSLAAPFVLAALLYNLALGAINRAMPALMVSFIGAPALTLGGLGLLAMGAPLMLEAWRSAMLQALAAPFGAP